MKLTTFRHVANMPKNLEVTIHAASFFLFCLDVKSGLALKRNEQRLTACENKVLTRVHEFWDERIKGWKMRYVQNSHNHTRCLMLQEIRSESLRMRLTGSTENIRNAHRIFVWKSEELWHRSRDLGGVGELNSHSIGTNYHLSDAT
jgi:hypothetical protein